MSEHQSELDEIAQRILDKSTEITLSAAIEHSHLRSAQTFLNAACSTVSETLLSFRLAREFAKEVTGQSARGRLTASDMDLLRAATMVAGAGRDAPMKALTRSGL